MGTGADRYLQSFGTPSVAPTQERTDADEYLGGFGGADAQRLRLTTGHGDPAVAERTARTLDLERRTGLPRDLIARNLDEIEQKAQASNYDIDQLRKTSPAVASWLAEHPDHASLAGDDVDKLSLIENIFVGLAGPRFMAPAYRAVFGRRSGAEQSELGRLGNLARERGGSDRLSTAQRDRIDRLQRQVAQEPGGLDFLDRVVYRGAQLFGQVASSAPRALASAFVGGAAGAAAGIPLGPPGMLATAKAGAEVGLATGFGWDTFQIEGGSAYLELSQMLDKSGQPIDEGTKQSIASAVGAVNAVLETAGVSIVASPYRTVMRKLMRESVKDAFVRPTMRAAMNDLGRSYLSAIAGETGTEVLQELSNVIGDEIAREGDAGTLPQLLSDPEKREAMIRRLADIAQQTSEGMVLLALPGAAIHGSTTAYQAYKATQRERFYLALGEQVANSKTFQRLPDAVQQVVERATKDGPIETVYAPVETFDSYWQSAKQDPAAVAEELGVKPQWEEAHATGGDIAIPIATYATKIAPTEHNAFFAKELRAKPNEMNAREAEAFRDRMKQAAEDVEDQAGTAPASAQQIEDEVTQQLVAAGYDEQTARTQASQMAAFFRTQSGRAGVDPLELFRRYNFSVTASERAAVAPIGQKVSLEEVANRALAFRERQAETEGIAAEDAGAKDSPYAVERDRRDAAQKTEAGEFVYARTDRGALRGNLQSISVDGLVEELAHLYGRNAEDAGNTAPSLMEEEGSGVGAVRVHVAHRGGAVQALGRISARKKSIARIEAELQRRGVDNADERLFKRLAGEDPTAFDPSAFQQPPRSALIDRFINYRGVATDPEMSSQVRAEAARRAAAIEREARAEYQAGIDAATREYEQRTGQSAADVFYQFPSFASLTQALPGGEAPRGQIKFKVGDQAAVSIELLADADLSTFLHETGHFYLEVMRDLATRENAAPEIARDFELIKEHTGWKEGQTAFTREQHELFARSFETYLMEGKAPSAELRGAFARFRAWLVGLYRSLDALQALLSDEVRGVFDRLLASEDEIAAAQREQHMEPLFADPAAVGMSENVAERYRNAVAEAQTSAENELAARLMADIQREQSQVYKAERAKVRAEVAQEVNEERDSAAFAFLSRGVLPDGSALPAELEPIKLSKQALEAEYASRYPNLLARLRAKFLYSKAGGAHPDQVAEWFGYASGDELIQDLLKYEGTPKQRIEQLTDERMRADDPNLVTPAELPVEAMKASHNEYRAKVLHMELQHLASENLPALKGLIRRIARRIPALPEITAQAERIVAAKRVREINPLLYQRAEEKAARLAVEAFTRGDIETAFDEKLRETLNHELYRIASKAKDEVEKVVGDLSRFATARVRERLGKAGGDYLAQVDALLSRFDFRKGVTNAQLDRRRSLREWYDEQVASGLAPTIPEKLLDEAYRTHYKELTLGDLRDVHDAVENIAHLAKLKNRLLASARAREIEAARQEIIDSIGAHHDLTQKPVGHPPSTLSRNLAKGAKRGLAEHTRMEFLFDYLDGFKGLGVVWQYLFKPFADAENAENKMHAANANALRDIFAAYTADEQRAWYSQKIHIPAAQTRKHDGTFTKAAIIAAALNWGNDYNRSALMEGYGWTVAQVETILGQLDQRDWQTVQRIWDHIESYWPEIAKLERELNGVVPQKVEASPLSGALVKGLDLRGGYYPILFDRERSTRQFSLEEGANVREMFGGNAYRAMTRHGHTIERTNTGGKPLKLELSGLADHLGQVVHDLSHRRAVVDVFRLVTDDDIAATIERAVGQEMYLQLRPWIQAIAGDRARSYSGFMERLLGKARQGATVVGLGLKVTSAALQTLGYTITVNELGPKYAAAGLRAAFRDPRKFFRLVKPDEFIGQRSAMMRDRLENYDRDVRDYARKQDAIEGSQAAWFAFIGYMDLATSIPTWLGAYRKAMDGALEGFEKGDEQSAIDYADKIVRETQAAGAAKDLASVQRGGEAWRLFTMFYSSMSVIFNQFARAGQRYALERNVPQLIGAVTLLWIMPVVMEAAIRGQHPDDDDSWAKFLLAKILTYPFGTVVLVRDFANALEQKLTRGRGDYSGSPAGDVGETILRGLYAATVKPFTDEDITRADWKAIVNSVGYAKRLPTAQAWKTAEYLYDWMTGTEQPDNPAEGIYRMLVAGKPR